MTQPRESDSPPPISGAIQLPPGIVGGAALGAAQLASGLFALATANLKGSASSYVLGPYVPGVPRFRTIALERIYAPIAALATNTAGQPQPSSASVQFSLKVRGIEGFIFREQLPLVPYPNGVNSMGNDAISEDLVNPIIMRYGEEAEVWYAVAFNEPVINWNLYLGIQLIDFSGTEQAAPGAVYFETAD